MKFWIDAQLSPALAPWISDTKDNDFLHLLQRFGPPPQIVWIICGNIPNVVMREILHQHFPNVILRLQTGTALIQIPDFT